MGLVFDFKPSPFEVSHARFIYLSREYQTFHGGDLPPTRPWGRLEHRWELNPARFDYFHPNVGRMIERWQEFRKEQDAKPCLGVKVVTPVNDLLSATCVPEPTGLINLFVGATLVASWLTARLAR